MKEFLKSNIVISSFTLFSIILISFWTLEKNSCTQIEVGYIETKIKIGCWHKGNK